MRTKETYYEQLEQIVARFGKAQLIPIKEAAEFVGCDHRTLMKQKDFPLKKVGSRYYVGTVNLASWLA